MTDNKNLVIRSEQHLMAQVEAANTRLAISSQLTQDVERRRFVEILKRIDKEQAVAFLSVYACLSDELIAKYEDKWDWKELSPNDVSLPWSLELIKRFEDKWDWRRLSWNEGLPWSLELIVRFEDKWVWEGLSRNKALPWSLELIERFEDKWNWKTKEYEYEFYHGLSSHEGLPWSLEFIERFKDKWEWSSLNQNAIDCLPKLSLEDIDEVMNHHCLLESSNQKYDEVISNHSALKSSSQVIDDDEYYHNDNQSAYYGDDGYLGDGMWSDSSKNDWNR